MLEVQPQVLIRAIFGELRLRLVSIRRDEFRVRCAAGGQMRPVKLGPSALVLLSIRVFGLHHRRQHVRGEFLDLLLLDVAVTIIV